MPSVAMTDNLVAASDGMILTLLGMIFLSFGIIALLIVCGLRNAARRNPFVDELLEEVAEAERKKPEDSLVHEGDKTSQPWEREGDWWKK
jgi:hypothetical protein